MSTICPKDEYSTITITSANSTSKNYRKEEGSSSNTSLARSLREQMMNVYNCKTKINVKNLMKHKKNKERRRDTEENTRGSSNVRSVLDASILPPLKDSSRGGGESVDE